MNKKDLLFVGVGEAGNKIVNEILKKDRRYVGLFINSSYRDLEALENAKDGNTYTIPNADGTGKNRTKSKQLLINNRHAIIEEILKYKTQKVINFAFSAGGGTGGGSVPMLIKALISMNIKKPINVICILPSYSENKRYKRNAIACWNELVSIQGINTFYILDNNKRTNKEDINVLFAEQFNEFMNMPSNDRTDNAIDEEELGVISLCKGSTVFYPLPNNESDARIGVAHGISDNIFADLNTDDEACEYLAIATKKDTYDHKKLEQTFKIKEYAVSSYSQKNNLVVATGYTPQKIAIEMLEENLKEEEKNLAENNNPLDDLKVKTDIEIKNNAEDNIIMNNNLNENDKKIEDKLNDDDLWESLMNM